MKTWTIALLLSTSLVAVAPCAGAQAFAPSATGPIERAQRAYASGQPERAADMLRRAAADSEKSGSYAEAIAALEALTQIQHKQGRPADAGRSLERIHDLNLRLNGVESPETIQAYRDVRDYYSATGMQAESQAFLGREIKQREQALGPDHLSLAGMLMDLANILSEQRQFAEAEPLNARAVSIREKALGEHPRTAASLYNLGITYSDLGKWPESVAAYNRALAIYEKSAEEPADVARTLTNLGHVYLHTDQYPEGEQTMIRAIGLWEQIQGAGGEAVALTAGNLGRLYLQREEPWLAEPLLDRALRIAEQNYGRQSLQAAKYAHLLSSAYSAQGKLDPAEELCERAYAVWQATLSRGHRDLATGAACLANVALRKNNFERAERFSREALEISIAYASPHNAAASHNLAALTSILIYGARLGEAQALLESYLPRLKSAYGAESEWFAYRLADYGHVCAKLDRRNEAQAAFEEAIRIIELRKGVEHAESRRITHDYATLVPD
ncbi:MAG: tetratricopeptide repeat protein [Candidatus Acidiferrales bacterium]